MLKPIRIYACPKCFTRWQSRRIRDGNKLGHRKPRVCPNCGGRKIDGPLTISAVRP